MVKNNVTNFFELIMKNEIKFIRKPVRQIFITPLYGGLRGRVD